MKNMFIFFNAFMKIYKLNFFHEIMKKIYISSY